MSWRKSVQAYTRCQLYNTKQLFVCYFHQYSSTSTCFSTQNNVKCLYESSNTDLSRRQLTEAVIQLQESSVQCHKVDLTKVPFTNLLHKRENQNTSLVDEQFATFTFLCYQKKKKFPCKAFTKYRLPAFMSFFLETVHVSEIKCIIL